jgi:hypothetical protein
MFNRTQTFNRTHRCSTGHTDFQQDTRIFNRTHRFSRRQINLQFYRFVSFNHYKLIGRKFETTNLLVLNTDRPVTSCRSLRPVEQCILTKPRYLIQHWHCGGKVCKFAVLWRHLGQTEVCPVAGVTCLAGIHLLPPSVRFGWREG